MSSSTALLFCMSAGTCTQFLVQRKVDAGPPVLVHVNVVKLLRVVSIWMPSTIIGVPINCARTNIFDYGVHMWNFLGKHAPRCPQLAHFVCLYAEPIVEVLATTNQMKIDSYWPVPPIYTSSS